MTEPSASQRRLDPLAFTEDALALRLIDRHHTHARYLERGLESRWVMGGSRAEERHSYHLLAIGLARTICREAAAEVLAIDPSETALARHIASASFIEGVERLARADQRVLWVLDDPRGRRAAA